MSQIYHMNEATICSLQKGGKVICEAISEPVQDKSVVKDEIGVPPNETVALLAWAGCFSGLEV